MLQRFRFKNIVRFSAGILRWIGENPFLGFLVLLFFALLISSAVFYQYVSVERDTDVQSEVIQTRFSQQVFQRVMQTWQEREEKFTQAEVVQRRNLFAPAQAAKELTEQ